MTQYDAVLMKVLPDLEGFRAELTRLNREESHFEGYVNDCFDELVDISVDKKTGGIKDDTNSYFPSDAQGQIKLIRELQVKYTRLQTKLVYDVLFSRDEQRDKMKKQDQVLSEKSIDLLMEYNRLNILKYKIDQGMTASKNKGFVTRQSDPSKLNAVLEGNQRDLKESYNTLKEMVHFFYNALK